MQQTSCTLYLASTEGHGRGGHFYDVRTVAEEIGRRRRALIVNFGRAPSPVLSDAETHFTFIPHRAGTYARSVRSLLRMIKGKTRPVLHAFDLPSLHLARTAAWIARIPVVFTKCGGPPPDGYFPNVPELVVYSAEDAIFFNGNPAFRGTRVSRIPQRVGAVDVDWERVRALRDRLGIGGSERNLILLRISRLIPHYERGFWSSIETVSRLRKAGAQIRLVLVGVPEDRGVLTRLLEGAPHYVSIVTEPEFTLNSSTLLGLADVAVATGRGVMEASSLGMPVLVPVDGADTPVLLSRETLSNLAAANFSPRSSSPVSDAASIRNLREILEDASVREGIGRVSREIFLEEFDVRRAADPLLEIYDSAIPTPPELGDFLRHFLRAQWPFLSPETRRLVGRFRSPESGGSAPMRGGGRS